MDERTANIYDKFRAENWNRMDPSARMQALQELANLSAEMNHAAPQAVRAEAMEGNTYGYFDGTAIVVNEHLVNDGVLVATVTDEETGETELMTHKVEDVNLQMMDTIFHEDYHSFQEQAVDGKIPQETLDAMGISKETLRNWEANDSYVNYVDPKVDGNLYRIQEVEKSAYQAGEVRTQEAFAYLNGKYGVDANYEAYVASIQEHGYDRNLEMARMRYGDIEIDRTLQGKMNERYHGDEVKYLNETSAEDVDRVLNKSMHNALHNVHRTEHAANVAEHASKNAHGNTNGVGGLGHANTSHNSLGGGANTHGAGEGMG